MLANRVREFTTTVGTGDITLGGALAGHVRFADAFAPGNSVIYVIEDGDNYEIGVGIFSGAASLARTTVSETLVDGVLDKDTPVAIALSGSARVYCAVSADYLLNPTKEADLIKEVTTDAGVYIDGVHLKDGGGVFSGSLGVVGDTSFGADVTFDGDVHVAGSILSDNNTGGIVVSSDTSVGVGSNIVMYPSAHAARANDMDLRVNSTPWLSWDNSDSTAFFSGSVSIAEDFLPQDHIVILNNNEIRWKDLGGTERTALELDSSNHFNVGTSAGGDVIFRGSSYMETARIKTNGDATFAGDVTLAPTNKLYLDGGTDTYIHERTANTVALLTGGVNRFEVNSAGNTILTGNIDAVDATFSGLITGNNGALLSGAATANSRLTLMQTTASLSGTVQQGASGFAISALGAQGIIFNTNGAQRLSIDSAGSATFYGDVSMAHLTSTGVSDSATSTSVTIDSGNNVSFAQDVFLGNGNAIKMRRNSGGTAIPVLYTPAGTDTVRMRLPGTTAANTLIIEGTDTLPKVTFDATGDLDLNTGVLKYGGSTLITRDGDTNFRDLVGSGKLTVYGGAKISVQNSVDGGSGHGIIGWVCGVALFWHFMGACLLGWLRLAFFPDMPAPPALGGSETLVTVLLSMLGLGGLRTVEKLKGVSRDKWVGK